MGNEYTYLDPDYLYTDRNTGVLHNRAVILDCVNHLHPFREGNGRAQREFLRVLALEKGLFINLNPPDNISVYERYMAGTIQGDMEKLADLLFELAVDS
jgi:cell filamentation protein